ncbi:hypothetical protein TWF730_002015 [Orbilia blumenaviensis]|uniref:F-box domain-containing protein n=1 Tax=Orbilia blumenaviensis TaxID=1796055 RepID=A0AAV9UDK5_9PEZI
MLTLFPKRPPKKSLLSLPDELLTQIAIYVRQTESWRWKLIQDIPVPLVEGQDIPVEIYRENINGNRDFERYKPDTVELEGLMGSCQRLRDITYPLFYERLSIADAAPKSGFESEGEVKKVSISVVPRFLEIIQTDPKRSEAVKILAIEEWWETDLWASSYWGGNATRGQREEAQKGKQVEWQRMIQVLNKIATDLGLGDQKFLDAIAEGKSDMILTLLIYSLPNLVELRFRKDTSHTGSYASRFKPPLLLEEALNTRSPRCESTLTKFEYGNAWGAAGRSWCPMAFQLLEFPGIQSFTAFGLRPSEQEEEGVVYDKEFGWGDKDIANYDDMEGRVKIFKSNAGRFSRPTSFIVGATVENTDTDCTCHTHGEDPATTCVCWIPQSKSCEIKHLVIDEFATAGIHLDKVICAPKALESLQLTRGWHYGSERISIGNAVLSHSASLTAFKIDFGGVYGRLLVRGLINLTHLEVENRLFQSDGMVNLAVPAEDPNTWLPPSLVSLKTFCSTARGTWYHCSPIGEVLRTLLPASLPNLKRITMQAFVNSMPLKEFRAVQGTLADRGISFEYSYLQTESPKCHSKDRGKRFFGLPDRTGKGDVVSRVVGHVKKLSLRKVSSPFKQG